MTATQAMQDYREGKRDMITYAEWAALVAERDRLMQSLDEARLALAATHQAGGRRKTDPQFSLTPAMVDLADQILQIGEAA